MSVEWKIGALIRSTSHRKAGAVHLVVRDAFSENGLDFPNDLSDPRRNRLVLPNREFESLLENSDIQDLFQHPARGLMVNDDGITFVDIRHLSRVKIEIARQHETGLQPGFNFALRNRISLFHNEINFPTGKSATVRNHRGNTRTDIQYNPALARLLWIEYWIHWGIQNCRQPVFQFTQR